MKRRNKGFIAFLSFGALVLGGVYFANSQPATVAKAITTTNADVSKFSLCYNDINPITANIDTVNQTMTTAGRWDGGFLLTNQFDTTASYYSLKAHVSGDVMNSGDGAIGFNIYHNFENYINYYLKWNNDVSETIAEGVFLMHVNGKWENECQIAKVPGAFTTAGNFTDVWTDSGQWGIGSLDAIIPMNLRNSTIINPVKGFDMTLHVTRTTHNSRLVDILQIQIDAYEIDGVTPITVYSTKRAVDALTNPFGNGEKYYASLPAKIGFYTFNIGNVTYSNIEFSSNKEVNNITSTMDVLGDNPTKAFIDNKNNTVTLNNTLENNGFYAFNDLDTTAPTFSLSADVSGTSDDVANSNIGFVIYYNEENYSNIYLNWGSIGTVESNKVVTVINGDSSTTYHGGKAPWNSSLSDISGTKILYSDDGYITDAPVPSGSEGNFNIFRGNSTVTIKNGFNFGITKIRAVYASKVVDVYQLNMTAKDKSGVTRTWYTCSWVSDAFTIVNSELMNATFKIGLYAYNANDVVFSNFVYNGDNLKVKDISQYVFGERSEGEFTFAGSDYASNWTYSSTKLSEHWEDLYPNTHYREVVAYTSNNLDDFYYGAELQYLNVVGEQSYISIVPYYLDSDNYVYLQYEYRSSSMFVTLSGRLNGEYLGGLEYLLDEQIYVDYNTSQKFETEINGNTFNIYLGETPKATYSFDFTKQDFANRTLTNSKVGFSFYNAAGDINNYQKSPSRIFPYTPSESQIPVICELGNRVDHGFVNYEITLPSYKAFNYLGEEISYSIKVLNPSEEEITLSENNSFTPLDLGTYKVEISATDEWGHNANTIAYEISVAKYVDPLVPVKKEMLWQTKFVLIFFGGILLATIALVILLIFKNKKEAKISEELNKKNKERNAKEFEDD